MQYTEDSICRQDIRIRQPKSGYRFALDAVLLARFIRTKPDDHLLEIGAGSGVITVLVAAWNPFESVTAIEIQPELAELCRSNFLLNNVRNATVVNDDVRNLKLNAGPFDLIFANPPYRKTGSGRLNPSEQKAIARHDLKLSLTELFECALDLVKPSGRMTLILPALREEDFQRERERTGLHVYEWKYVHSFAGEPPAFFLLTIGRTPTQSLVHPPWIIYEKPGVYTAEMNAILH